MKEYRTHGWLVDELDMRDPRDDLHDIDCGKYLEALHNLPNSFRLLLENNTMHAEIQEIGGRYQIVSICKQRESEFLQGNERYFAYNKIGERISLTEKEYDELLGIESNPEDVYNQEDIDFETIDKEHSAPMDRWDLLFDAKEYIREAKNFIREYNYNPQNFDLSPSEHLEKLKETIYSSDWFPYSADKRIHTPKAKEIAKNIQGNFPKSKLGKMLGPIEIDKRPQIALELKTEAGRIKSPKEKIEKIKRATRMIVGVCKERKAGKFIENNIPNSDRKKLWELWQKNEIETKGESKLPVWKFKKAYAVKLQKKITKGEINRVEAEQLFAQKVFKNYGIKAELKEFDEKEESIVSLWFKNNKEKLKDI